MREIKFRAWDTRGARHMYYENPGATLDDLRNPGYGVWMQYTGLKDKNGKEIYEGDVIDYFNPESDQRRQDEVKFISGCFVPDIWRTTVDGCEVIGNIYENPELLPSI